MAHIGYGRWDGDPTLFIGPAAFVLVDGKWHEVKYGPAAHASIEMTKQEFDDWFGQVPDLPKTLSQDRSALDDAGQAPDARITLS